MIIKGNTVGTTTPRSNWNQNDPKKADYIIGKEVVNEAIQGARTAADDAQTAANNAQTAANNAQTAADNALPKSGGSMTGDIAMDGKKVTGLPTPSADSDAATKQYVDERKATASATLNAAGWSEKTQTVSVPGVTADNIVLVTPAPNSYVAYGEAVVYCSAQSDDHLTFTCEDVPAGDLTVNILIMN